MFRLNCCSCKVVIEKEKFKAVSNLVWVCLKSYDLREDNKKINLTIITTTFAHSVAFEYLPG